MLSLSFNRSDGVMRTMNTEKLLKTISVIQNQMDALLDFNVSAQYRQRSELVADTSNLQRWEYQR